MKRILLVEDDFNLNETISIFLGAKGYEITPALCGKDAISIVQKSTPPFDLILCDINLPDILGYDVFRMVKKIEHNTSKFIFLTAYADKVFIEDATRLGADDYVTKPFAFEELIMVIEKHISAV